MPYPEHPNTKIIRNEYYKSGLTELKIWNHYQRNKNKIIEYINNKYVMLFIIPEMNKYIIRRKIDGKPFTLNKNNFDLVMTGRTISIAVEQSNRTDRLIIDIDPPKSNINENSLKEAIGDILSSSSIHNVLFNKVYCTGRGYHIHFVLKNKINISDGKELLLSELRKFEDKYDINKKSSSRINLDLSVMNNKSVYVVPYSLNRNGLICMDITNRWLTFKRVDSRLI